MWFFYSLTEGAFVNMLISLLLLLFETFNFWSIGTCVLNKTILFILEIKGKQKCNVTRARNQLQNIIDLHRADQPSTHFLCIPLDAEHITSTFSDFKKNAMDLQVIFST